MPRRWPVDGVICHVYNRAAGKLPLFVDAADYRAFLGLLARTKQDCPSIRLHGYCVMPNHWHLIICAQTTAALSHFMRLLTHRHAVAHIAAHPHRSGAIYQGRFQCVPVQDGHHLDTVLQYVDRNPKRARLVLRAEQWLWSSTIGHAGLEADALLDPIAGASLGDWLSRVNELDPQDLAVRHSLSKRVPVGDSDWLGRLGADWNQKRRPRGRPRKISRVEFPP